MAAARNDSLDGTWQLVRAEFDGEAAHELLTANTVLEFKAGAYTVRYAGEMTDRGTFDLNSTGDGEVLVLRGTEGPNAGRTIPCIYQQVGDRLRVCYGLNGKVPPEFATATGRERYLASYRRSY